MSGKAKFAESTKSRLDQVRIGNVTIYKVPGEPAEVIGMYVTDGPYKKESKVWQITERDKNELRLRQINPLSEGENDTMRSLTTRSNTNLYQLSTEQRMKIDI